jgi:hypothetical protein
MFRIALTFGLVVVALSATGCKRGRGDSLLEKKIALHNDLAEAIEKKDAIRVQRIIDEWKELNERMKQMNLTEDELKRLTDKYKADWEKADARYRAAVEKEPEFVEKIGGEAGK